MEFKQLCEAMHQKARARMPDHLSHLNWSKEQIAAYQLDSLRKILTHSKAHTAYYQKLLDHIDTESFQLSDLNEIPITTKLDTLTHWDDFIANQIITRPEAEAHLQKLRDGEIDNPFYEDKYLLFATGGSSGQRGLFVWEADDFTNFICLGFRYQMRDQAAKNHSGDKIAVMAAPTWLHGSLAMFTAKVDEASEIKHFSASMPLMKMAKGLEEFQPDQLIGYSSVIAELSHLANSGRLNLPNINRVSTNSEPLTADDRKSIRKAWNVEVNNMWGSTEAGIMGIEDDEHIGMWVPDDYCILEPVDEDLNPVADPKDARKLIVTNLFNFTFPIIRYVVDDTTAIKHIPDRPFRLAASIEGRTDDWLLYHDLIKIHPMNFRHILGQHQAIDEYQVVQTENGADISLITNADLDVSTIEQSITHDLEDAGLGNAEVKVKVVSELARHKETGKLKRFVPLR